MLSLAFRWPNARSRAKAQPPCPAHRSATTTSGTIPSTRLAGPSAMKVSLWRGSTAASVTPCIVCNKPNAATFRVARGGSVKMLIGVSPSRKRVGHLHPRITSLWVSIVMESIISKASQRHSVACMLGPMDTSQVQNKVMKSRTTALAAE